LRVKALGFRLWLAALSLRKDYQTEATLQEFNELDSDNFLDDL
jgi:hypothetical protein